MSDSPPPADLRPAEPSDVDVIAQWARTPEETEQWSSSQHPVSVEDVLGWWADPDVQPWILVDAKRQPVGYGELWLDAEEDEVELARLIVVPELRGHGLGRSLVRLLVEKAATTGLATTMLRVVPENQRAIRCYLASGFGLLGPEETALWNEGQRRQYAWMVLPPAG